MSAHHFITQLAKRYPNLSALSYVALVIAGFLVAAIAAAQIEARYRAISDSHEMLARLQGRASTGAGQPSSLDRAAKPSAFLSGPSITVAGASLMQRVATIITAAGGTISSSEVEPQTAQGKDGYVKVTVSCEVEQNKLQQLLYEIEAGMPFLFIEQLIAQGPLPENPRMRVVVEVSGIWSGAR